MPLAAMVLGGMEYRRRSGGASGRLCEVCCEEVEDESKMAGCTQCTHRYCMMCVKRYWEKQIFSGAHDRLSCMHGGCGVQASDSDVQLVVDTRAYRRMIYFRTRDKNPNSKFCPYEPCWAELPSTTNSVVTCSECERFVCVSCEQPWSTSHVCATPKNRGTFASRLWAATHTKACPSCNTRIQRARGCAHMTCARCTAYFCWRCRGFLHNDCNRGRTCVCDKIIHSVAYGGMAAVAVIGAPVILTGVILGGAPWLVYHFVKRNRGSNTGTAANAPNGIDQPILVPAGVEFEDDFAHFLAPRNRNISTVAQHASAGTHVTANSTGAVVMASDVTTVMANVIDDASPDSGSVADGGGAELRRRNTK